MPQNFYELVWIFIIYAFIGWCTEVSYAALDRGIFVNRGFLNGPYCPIYGCGVVIVVAVLTPLKDNLLILFAGSLLLTSIWNTLPDLFWKSVSQQVVGLQQQAIQSAWICVFEIFHLLGTCMYIHYGCDSSDHLQGHHHDPSHSWGCAAQHSHGGFCC